MHVREFLEERKEKHTLEAFIKRLDLQTALSFFIALTAKLNDSWTFASWETEELTDDQRGLLGYYESLLHEDLAYKFYGTLLDDSIASLDIFEQVLARKFRPLTTPRAVKTFSETMK